MERERERKERQKNRQDSVSSPLKAGAISFHCNEVQPKLINCTLNDGHTPLALPPRFPTPSLISHISAVRRLLGLSVPPNGERH